MDKWREIETTSKVLDDRLCNQCGESTMKSCGSEAAHLTANWGYDSRKDMECHDSHLCEDCYDKLIEGFKIRPSFVR